MSNITFDIKCIRADPQAGICEISSGGSGGSSTCDCSQGTYTPNVVIPVQTLPLINAFTTVNLTPVGVWSRVNNRYQVTVIVNVSHNTTSPFETVGTLQISLPVIPGAIPPVGLANWSGSGGADYAVPGVVFPQGGPLTIAEVTVKAFPSGTSPGVVIVNFTYEV